MSSPRVSVLMIVHNRAHTVGAAVRSVLMQTLDDLELIVVDDGSTDDTAQVVQGFADPRLRLVRLPSNLGIPIARNCALAEARAKYIAWLDSDDLCHPERLSVQHEFLQRHPELDMIGSAARKIAADGTLMKSGRVPPRSHGQIRALLLFRSAFQQSSIFGRTEKLLEMAYDPDFPVCEDVDMFARFTECHRSANLPLFLIARRIHPGQTIRHHIDLILDRQMAISERLLTRLGLHPSGEELRNHVVVGGCCDIHLSDAVLDWAWGWFERIIAANARRLVYDEAELRTCLQFVLLKACLRRFGKHPAQVGRLLGHLARFPLGTAALIRDFGLPFLPLAGRPSSAPFRMLTTG